MLRSTENLELYSLNKLLEIKYKVIILELGAKYNNILMPKNYNMNICTWYNKVLYEKVRRT